MTLPSGAGSIAVIGLACRFPGADSPDEFWRNLRASEESITFFTEEELLAAGVSPEELRDPSYVPAKGTLDGADCFDAAFFGYSPREAALMDPQQRVFLECAWSALEDAGYDPLRHPGSIGVFAGSILSIYLVQNLAPNRRLVAEAGNFQTAVGNDPTFLATSTSYHLDLRGPSISVGTACSTSLVAVHLACQSLLSHESELALAGAVSVHLPLIGGYRYEQGSILSPDGHCRPFDAAAQGTVSSDGVGIVVLKRLDDALADGDFVHAVILGSALNNDGRQKVGFTAPSVPGEAQIIIEAMAMAGVEPESMSMIEAHGAGTLLGDPIEFAALVEAFGPWAGKRASCALGSVKSNVGHLDAAAGIAGLIKTVLALEHREIPPTLHFREANPEIAFGDTPFYVNDRLRAVSDSDSPMRAGVSAFGIGGTNAHLVLEEAPSTAREPARREPRAFDLLVLSARTPAALEAATDRLVGRLGQSPELDLADVCHTLRRGRRAFEHRRFLVSADREEALAALRTRDRERLVTGVAGSESPSVAFLFPGLGDHHPGMGWELYRTQSEFRAAVDRCADLLRPHLGTDVRDALYPDRDGSNPLIDRASESSQDTASNLDLRAMLGRARPAEEEDSSRDDPVAAQPAIFVTEVALAKLLASWGVEPAAMIGHSIGEFAAAYLSGVLSLADALELVATRARLIQTQVAPGVMVAVPLGEARLGELLPAGVSLGAVNTGELSIASGEAGAVAELETALEERGVSCRRLRSTHAYHSRMMEAIVEPLTALLRRLELRAPRIPYVSCITGTWITDEEATSPDYWARHLCLTVRFQAGLDSLLEDPRRVLLEVGPGQGLTSHAIRERSRIGGENPVIPTMRWSYGRQPEVAVLLRGCGQLWMAGVPLDESRFLSREDQRRVPLPTYPFERQRYWIDPPSPGETALPDPSPLKRQDVADWFYLPYWKPSARRREPESGGPGRSWLVFIDGCGVGQDLAQELRAQGHRVATVAPGSGFSSSGDEFVLDPLRAEDYRAMVRELSERGELPETVVHCWGLTPAERSAPSRQRFTRLQETGFHSLLRLIQALIREGRRSSVRLELVANHLWELSGDDELVPEKTTLLGPAMVAPQEVAGLSCRTLDTDIPPEDPARRRQLVAQLLEEIRSEPTDQAVAYRRGLRWVRGYEPIRLADVDLERSPFRQRGVYLLTGGLGGVALVLARHLAETVQARLVLIGRSAFPERDDWRGWLAEHDESDRTSRRIHRLLALEELGSQVLVLSADVSSREAMKRALSAVDERFGELHGVIHGAGAVGIETFKEIGQATAADAETQFNAKVHGVLVLEEVLEGRPLDFCLLMSSLSAILGGLGFSAYSAANLFMDAFVRWKNRRSAVRWTSVDWDSWQLSDVKPVIAGLGATVSEYVMSPEEGAAACERILSEGALGQVVVSSGDLRARLGQWIERNGRSDGEAREGPLHERPALGTPYEAPRGALERKLAEIWQELFGVASVGVHDNFFELGGHSLLATQLNARLFSELRVEMPLATVLGTPTVAELAVAVVDRRLAGADPSVVEKMLAEVGGLSGQEVRSLLAEEEVSETAIEGDD